jgi:hypothetical protein
LERSYIADGKWKMVQSFEKQSGNSSIKQLPHDPETPPLGVRPREMKTYIQTKT